MNEWLGAVGIPYLALLVLALIEGRGASPDFAHRFLELGIDACILGIGVTGALFASHEVRTKVGESGVLIATALILLDVGITGLSLHLRNFPISANWKARWGIFMGLIILGINSGIVWRYST